jgi:hypothetical protein
MICGGYQAKRISSAVWKVEPSETHHFYVSSAATWMVGYDVADLIRQMRLEGLCFNLWIVPGPKNAPYKIEMFAPQVEGAVCIAFYNKELT